MLENGVLSRKRQRYCSLAVVIHTSTRNSFLEDQFREAVHMVSSPYSGPPNPVLVTGVTRCMFFDMVVAWSMFFDSNLASSL